MFEMRIQYSQQLQIAGISQDLRLPRGNWQRPAVFSQARFRIAHYTAAMGMRLHQIHPVTMLLLGTLLAGCATTPPSRTDDICTVFREKRGWHDVAVKAEQKWGTSMHTVMAIMNQESAFRKSARPPRKKLLGVIPWKRPSSAYGYAQVIDGTWAEYVAATGDYWRKRNNFADASDFVHWYIAEAVRRNGVSSSDTYNLYLNYHEGPAGFRRGTYKKKQWLGGVALKVQRRAENYSAQYARCKHTLKRGFWSRLLGG